MIQRVGAKKRDLSMTSSNVTSRVTVIVEPWFTAAGHPAQSLLNTARALQNNKQIKFLASRRKLTAGFTNDIASMLERIGDIEWFAVPSDSLVLGTLLAAYRLVRLARSQNRIRMDVFFLDAHLISLGMCIPFMRRFAPNIGQIGCLVLWGPEGVSSNLIARRIVRSFLRAPMTRLFLRTEELALAWRAKFAAAPGEKINALPSLEVSQDELSPSITALDGPKRFGLFGQIRDGKGIDWLVPLFTQHPEIGRLRVVGKATSAGADRELATLRSLPDFEHRFVPEAELLSLASSVDFLLVLYDRWDHRMEAATLYLAARASKPVICYAQGWCGRMVESFGCGISVPPTQVIGADFFASLPARDSAAYEELVRGIGEFRNWVSAPDRVAEFTRAIRTDDSVWRLDA